MAPTTIETLRLMVVSTEVSVLRLLGSTAQSNSWHLETSANGWDAMERVQSGAAPHLLLLDIPPGDGDGSPPLVVAEKAPSGASDRGTCAMPHDSDRQKEATRMGAKDMLVRPVTEEQIESLIRRYLGWSDDCGEPEIASEDIKSIGEDEFFLSITPTMHQLRTQVELLAQADVPVLILGEPGSGKGTVARLIHQMSVYSGFNLLRVNCAEMPGDLLEIEFFGRRERLSRIFGRVEKEQPGQTRDWSKGHASTR